MQQSSIKAACLLALCLAVAGPGRAEAQCGTTSVTQTLTDGDGFTWDVTGAGDIQNGTIDTYDEGWVLSVNGTLVPVDATPTLELGGRQVALDSTVSGVNVVRRLYVPSGAPGFARILDSFTNPTASSVTLSILMQVNMGSDGSTVIVGTSSGDTAFTTADRWVSSDDVDGAGDPSNGLVFYGAGAAVVPSTTSTTVFDCAGSQGYAVTYSLTLAAGETRSLMHLAVQRNSRAAIATALASLETATVMSGGETVDGALGALITSGGLSVQAARDEVDARSAVEAQAKSARDSISGVNSDDEMVALTQYQRAYEAATKVVQTADEMLQTLLQLKR